MNSLIKIAHRGASGYAPENTLAAFSKAIEMGAGSIEFDVQQTRDKQLVVIHDADLKRVAKTKGRIRTTDYADLARLDVGSWFNPKFKGESVPLLEDLLDLVETKSPGRMELHLEIKNGLPSYKGIEARILDLLKSRKEWNGRVIISSFDHRALARVRDLDPRMRLGYLVGLTRLSVAIREAKKLGCESIHMSVRRVDRHWVKAVKNAGRKILIYTVNTPAQLRYMMDLGVDGIFTNFPDLNVDTMSPHPHPLPKGEGEQHRPPATKQDRPSQQMGEGTQDKSPLPQRERAG